MLQHCHKVHNVFSSGYSNFESEYYTNLDQIFSSQTGFSRHNHTENKDPKISGMDIKVDAIQTATNIPECMSIPQLQQGTSQDDNLQLQNGYIVMGWPETRDQMS